MTDTPVTAAYYTPWPKGRWAILDIAILHNGRREVTAEHIVKNKREARKLALSLGATPWNF